MAILLEGIFPALWTPTKENGELLAEEFRSNADFVLRAGAHGFMALGSTGEFIQLSSAERKRTLEIAVELAGQRVVIANVSHIRPADVFDLGRHARSVGAAAIALLPPWFFPLAPDDLVEFFVKAQHAAQLPLVLYNFPELTGKKLELDVIARIADAVPVAGIKQSGGEFSYHAPLVKLGREKGFSVVTGADTRIVEAMGIGVTGCVGGLGNVAPELMVEIYAAVAAGEPESALAATEKMAVIGRRLDALKFPLNVAAAMEARGLAVGTPKSLVSGHTRRAYQELKHGLRELFESWRLPIL